MATRVLGAGSLEGDVGRGAGPHARSLSIAGGTTEVNKNIVAERVLGLPREPLVSTRPGVSTSPDAVIGRFTPGRG